MKQSFDEFAQVIEQDRQHGAGELARMCLQRLAEDSASVNADSAEKLRNELVRRSQKLETLRPSMGPIIGLMQRYRKQITASRGVDDLDAFRRKTEKTAQSLLLHSRKAAEQAAGNAAEFIRKKNWKTVITCSMSSTVTDCFRKLGSGCRPIIPESRPLCEGWALARQLAEAGIALTFITDAQMGLFAAKADCALVGADAVLNNGSVVNKAGTLLLALAAKQAGIPFLVCCESFKQISRSPADIELEEMSASEIRTDIPDRISVRNIYFEITPPALITELITEAQ